MAKSMANASDVVCIGGGAIGLSLAYELAQRSVRVVVVDRGPLGKESSWAGAGILSPPPAAADSDDGKFRLVSYHAFPPLARRLFELTGVDVGLRDTGGVHLAFGVEEAAALGGLCDEWRSEQIPVERLDENSLIRFEPRLRRVPAAACFLPGVRQVRNPRFVRALEAACRLGGVDLRPNQETVAIQCDGEAAVGVRLADGTTIPAGNVVVTSGAWAARFLELAGEPAPIYPVRGQIVAYQTTGHVVKHVVEVGKRYLVPRDDGLVLVGSTEEEAGFDRSTTDEGLGGLHDFAVDLFPELEACPVAASWAGLRPGNRLGFPWIGRVEPYRNVWAGCGHFRQGIQLSTGTSRLLADWITGSASFVDVDAFQPARRQRAFHTSFHS